MHNVTDGTRVVGSKSRQFHKDWTFKQGIINMNRNGNSANFFSYVCNGKKIEELFAPAVLDVCLL